ncbi:MAG: TonB-dependent receptor [Flavobacteriales bacterium CG_4_9_14_3_um_filter_32_8]|nr:MAG: TonB-dependent receptor [Flavobacteriales bacterium CG_4_9_14_3_um_filter_32_8]
MKNSLLILFSFLFVFHSDVFSQKKYTISGYVKDKANGENSVGASIYIKELLKGNTSSTYGYYSITIEEGEYTIVVSYMGYKDIEQKISLHKDLRINFEIEEDVITTEEFQVIGEREDQNTNEAKMSTVELEVEQIKSLPAIFGEIDILKTIQLLPGVQSAGEGNSGFYVRGGGPDQNLILLDGATIYNASHLFGFFSVFNADAIKDVELIKGGMPAEFGGRLSSVLDITMNDGNFKEYKVDGGIGIISSRLTIQGPIKKDTASFIISGRRTYLGEIIQPFISDSSKFKGSNYYFYDLNAKFNWIVSEKDRLYLSGYFGRDVFTFKNSDDGFGMSTPWGNTIASLRWNHLFNNKLFLNTSVIYTDYQFEVGLEQDQFEFRLYSGVTDWNAKLDFNYLPSILHNVKFGANYIFHKFVPSNASAKSGEVDFNTGDIIINYAHDAAFYASDDWDVTEKLKVHGGLRYSLFQQIGPFKRYNNDEFGNPKDTTVYDKGEAVKLYQGLEPRFTMRYNINNQSSVKASYTQNYQYIHLASFASVSLPTDVWVPSTDLVQPQFSTQYATGYFRNFKENKFESSVEVYYKTMENQIEYSDGALPKDNAGNNVDNAFTFGKGWSYGAELFFKKKFGKVNGWVGYTLSWTKRQFDELNNGEVFFAKYDRRHDVSIVFTYDISKRLTLGATWVYASGNAITLPVSRYVIQGQIVSEYGDRNWYRMDAYHRMDLSLTLKGKETKKFKSSWNFSVYNVYNRQNPYFIYFANEGDVSAGTLNVQAKQVSLFGIIPSIAWNFSF